MPMLVKTTPQDEDRRDPSWRTKTGTPFAWMYQDGKTIRLNRIQAVGTTATLGYMQRPTVLALPTDAVDARIADVFQGALKWAMASYLLGMVSEHQDLEKSAAYMKEFYRQIGVTPGPLANPVVER